MQTWLGAATNRVKRFLVEGSYFWLAVVPVIAAIGIVVAYPFEPVARWTSAVLQFLGLGIVAFGIRETRKTFGFAPFRKLLDNWIAGLLGKRSQRIHVGAGSATLSGIAIASAIGTVGLPPNATVEQRMAALETKLQNLTNLATQTTRGLATETQARKDAIATESQARATDIEKLRGLVREAVAGGVALETAGVVWLLAGIVLSALAPEL